jgi:hypothetical protein
VLKKKVIVVVCVEEESREMLSLCNISSILSIIEWLANPSHHKNKQKKSIVPRRGEFEFDLEEMPERAHLIGFQ